MSTGVNASDGASEEPADAGPSDANRHGGESATERVTDASDVPGDADQVTTTSCPDCAGLVSIHARSCVHCGAPLLKTASGQTQKPRMQSAVAWMKQNKKALVIIAGLVALLALLVIVVTRIQASRDYNRIKASPPPGLSEANWSNYLYLQKEDGVRPSLAASHLIVVVMKLQITGTSDCSVVGSSDLDYQANAEQLVGADNPSDTFGNSSTLDAGWANAYVYGTAAFCKAGGIAVDDPDWQAWLGTSG